MSRKQTAGRPAFERATVTTASVTLAALMLMTAVQLYAYRRALGEEASAADALLFGIVSWGVWAVAVPVIVTVARRFDFTRGRRAVSVVVHVPLMLACDVASTALIFHGGQALFGEGRAVPWREVLQQSLAGGRLHIAIVLYAAILVLARTLEIRGRLGEERARAARSEALASQARLAALAARLQPHFLFNSLHAVGALIDEDPARARTMLAQLGDLLRDALAEEGGGEVTLAEEFGLLERYLAIERVRFTDRLQVSLSLDPAVASLRVPRFLLQPLVENALHHGIAKSASGGRVSVVAVPVAGGVRLTVANDGSTLADQVRERGGLGATRERLRIRHGDAARLDVRRAASGGTEAEMFIPADGEPGR